MNYNQTTIGQMFDSKVSFRIPVYQRAYAWERDNWKMFLDDILEQIHLGNAYTFGNILLEKNDNPNVYDIIDGQQRLSTLIVFMRALINVLEKKDYDKQKIAYLTEDYLQGRGVKRLRPVDYDQTFFDSVIIEGKGMDANSDSQRKYKEALDFFNKELSCKNLDELLEIKNLIEGTTINRLELDGKSEAALMFELQNNRGKSLTNLEKLKSYFMYQVYINSDKKVVESNVEALSNYFKEIYRLAHDIKGVQEDSILIYFCNSFLNKAFAYRNLDDIKAEYKKNSEETSDAEKGKARINWINDFTYNLYQAFNAIKSIQQGNFKYYKKLQALSNSGGSIPTFAYAFIIKGYSFFKDDKKKLEDLMHILEILAFRANLINTRADLNSRLSQIIKDFNGNLDQLRSSLQKKLNEEGYWSDVRMKEFLGGDMYGNKVLHYLLWEYENHLQKKGYSVGQADIENEEIEHISPRTPTNGKKIEIGYDVNEKGEYNEDFIEKHLNSIGNLMLIAKSHNASIGNNKFTDKLASYENPPLQQQSEIKGIVEEIGEGKRWGVKHIENRKQKILEFAIPEWSF
ncbi:MAG: DUF262 domain-containing HNH endonuclease family protein [Muribaculaceae bacterium]|nr:DUF262 domain-containing HNH endonuclease family protein [Muribaculaceae bacterium]